LKPPTFSRPKRYFLVLLAVFGGVEARAATDAEKALATMKAPEGFEVKLVASEPEIRQPISVTFDERGRMWVIQYLQYPAPAGLKPVKVDQYLRTTYDRLPEPPPRGPKGADRITICEDTDGDGRMDKFKDFVTGLNLCSGMAIGHGGVFVVQPPYLLFYPDANRDDVPDRDPEVLLTGFGMEDAHAFANSLTWGPDGWLYGVQGSTVTAHIRGIEFQQGVWRYHPRTHVFELFAEGGGNTWGLDFDSEGEIFIGTNYYEKMLHAVQGAYYTKNFGKHGELHNPHAYGYFEHVPFSGYKGLHISIGGIIYHGGALAPLEGAYVFGNTLDHAIYWATLKPQGSSFTASYSGALLKTDDEVFRPVDCQTGPDGAIYISDWCDKRATHVDPLDTWDRSNGRIYKIEARGLTDSKPTAEAFVSKNQKFDLAKLSSNELVDLLGHANDWFVRQAQQLLAERRDPKVGSRLRAQVLNQGDAHVQLESLWALYVTAGLDDDLADKLLEHGSATIRKWVVRFLGDAGRITQPQHATLARLARTETNTPVRAQLACSLKRLKGKVALPLLREMLLRADDENDPHIPLLLWWALENKALSDREEVLNLFSSAELRGSVLVRRHILERIGRRYAEEGQDEDLAACAKLLEFATVGEDGKNPELRPLLTGMEQGFAGKTFTSVPRPLKSWLDRAWPKSDGGVLLTCFGLRLGDERARHAGLNLIADSKAPERDRLRMISICGETSWNEAISVLLSLCDKKESSGVKAAALNALQRFPDVAIGERVLAMYLQFSPEVRPRAIDLLCSRRAWSDLLVEAVKNGKLPATGVSRGRLQQMVSLKDEGLNKRIEKLWGKVQSATPAEKQNFINQAKLILKPSGVAGRTGQGDASAGKIVFQQSCAVCHKLYGEGNEIGPDLTGVDRKNTESLLTNIVDPSAYIRPEYVSYEVETRDDQTLSGLMVESMPSAVTLLDRSNQRHTISREQIRSLRESQVSLMPEGLLESLAPRQLMDLFSYLQKD
jgi:putative membrane-bound dehydrogenase-like protein